MEDKFVYNFLLKGDCLEFCHFTEIQQLLKSVSNSETDRKQQQEQNRWFFSKQDGCPGELATGAITILEICVMQNVIELKKYSDPCHPHAKYLACLC